MVYAMGSPDALHGSAALTAMLKGMLQAFPNMHVSNDYPLQFGEGDWTTAMARVSGTFSGKMGEARWDLDTRHRQVFRRMDDR